MPGIAQGSPAASASSGDPHNEAELDLKRPKVKANSEEAFPLPAKRDAQGLGGTWFDANKGQPSLALEAAGPACEQDDISSFACFRIAVRACSTAGRRITWGGGLPSANFIELGSAPIARGEVRRPSISPSITLPSVVKVAWRMPWKAGP